MLNDDVIRHIKTYLIKCDKCKRYNILDKENKCFRCHAIYCPSCSINIFKIFVKKNLHTAYCEICFLEAFNPNIIY